MGENLLAIDCGTQSVRALLFNPQGDLLAKAKVPIDSYKSPQPGWAELNPDEFWKALCEACQKLFNSEQVRKSEIAAVAITTQRSTLVNMDEDGQPLRPAIIWSDQRRAETYKRVGGLWGALFDISGMRPTVDYLQSESEANWINEHQPEIWKKTYRFTFLSGYFTHRLTGEFKDSVGCQVGYMPFDYKTQAWAAKSHWYWQALAIEREKLVDLVPVGSPLGTITPEAAADTGIPAGSLEPNVACLSYGTTATINTTHKKYIEFIPLIPPYPAAIPNMYNVEMQIYRGYWMVNWFKNEFGLRERGIAAEQGTEPEALFDDLVRSVPPGSEGLVLQPYWSPGLRHPGPEARGAIIGFRHEHTRAHIYRAILEGLAFALLEGKERTEKRSGIAIDQIRIAGGGSQSDAAMQLTADVFGLPVSRPHLYEASGLGAAINAAVGVGLHPDYPTAMNAMTRLGETFEPDMQTHSVYKDLYQGVYLKMYKMLRPFYKTMQHINLPKQWHV